jgi:hypothetical protein
VVCFRDLSSNGAWILSEKSTLLPVGNTDGILTATNFFTKWIEAIPTRSASHKVIIGFLEPLAKFCEQFGIKLIHSTPYYPQGNGLAESSNKSLIRIIKRLLEDNKRAWNSKLKFALWADRVTTKRSIGISPF